MMLMGPGIIGGRVVGATDYYQSPLTVDLRRLSFLRAVSESRRDISPPCAITPRPLQTLMFNATRGPALRSWVTQLIRP